MKDFELTRCIELDENGQRCNQPAEITGRCYLEDSSNNLVEHIRTRCIDGHHLFLPEMIDRAA